MTQKRKHFLERIIRKEYNQFERMLIGKNNSMRIITQLFNLIQYKIEYLYCIRRINYDEKVFMKQCNINYMHYYHKMVQHIYQ
jgi:hypothetical protein|nr:MAG TPA: hypothetical protein [Caudoviricetes sp.]